MCLYIGPSKAFQWPELIICAPFTKSKTLVCSIGKIKRFRDFELNQSPSRRMEDGRKESVGNKCSCDKTFRVCWTTHPSWVSLQRDQGYTRSPPLHPYVVWVHPRLPPPPLSLIFSLQHLSFRLPQLFPNALFSHKGKKARERVRDKE